MRDRETDRERDRQRHRQRETHTDRERTCMSQCAHELLRALIIWRTMKLFRPKESSSRYVFRDVKRAGGGMVLGLTMGPCLECPSPRLECPSPVAQDAHSVKDLFESCQS